MDKIYPKLYTQDTTGKTREWWMEQSENKYRTHSCVQDGQIVTSEWTEVEGKNIGKANETSGVTQATKEIEAKYTKQLKTGYHKNVKNIGMSSYVEPMLAKSLKDYRDKINFLTESWELQCKFNGMRCIATRDGLFTRKGERYQSVPHIEAALKPFFKNNPNAVLDGELFNNELRQQLNEIAKLVRKTKHITTEDLKQSAEMVKYYVYDGYGFNNLGPTAPYSQRKDWINKNIVGKVSYTAAVKSVSIKSDVELNQAYQEYIEEGHEGAMLRKVDQGYENKRSKYLLKVKPEDDSEAKIIAVMEGNGNWSGTAKTATLEWEGRTFDATFKGNQEELATILKNQKDWLGKEVTFLYNGLTGLNIPNFARIDVKNCFKR